MNHPLINSIIKNHPKYTGLPGQCVPALGLDAQEWKDLGLDLFQRAQQTLGATSDTPEVKELRLKALVLVSRVMGWVDKDPVKEALAVAQERGVSIDTLRAPVMFQYLTLTRRLVEEDLLARGLSFGDRLPLTEVLDRGTDHLAQALMNPGKAFRTTLGKLKSMQLEPLVAADVGYEEAYWKAMVENKYPEAVASLYDWSMRCNEAGDPVGATIFQLQGAKFGLDGNRKEIYGFEQAAANLIVLYENLMPTLNAHRGDKRLKNWIESTMLYHLAEAAELSPSLAETCVHRQRDLKRIAAGTYVVAPVSEDLGTGDQGGPAVLRATPPGNIEGTFEEPPPAV